MGVFFINWITRLQGATRNLLLRSAIFVAYLLIGTIVFKTLESSNEIKDKNKFRVRKTQFQKAYGINDTVFHEFMEEIRIAVDEGFFDEEFDRWSFFGSLFFTATVLTTIGFGHMTPHTFGGRLFCMLYAFFGIPITGLMLKSIGERLVTSIDKLALCIRRKMNKKNSSACEIYDENEDSFIAFFTTIILILIMVVMLTVLAAVSMDYEGWTFFEGCYFGFITLSTIGFGDFVPTTPKQGFGGASHEHIVLFVFFTAIYITIGLSVVSSILVSLSRLFESKTEWKLLSIHDDDEIDANDVMRYNDDPGCSDINGNHRYKLFSKK